VKLQFDANQQYQLDAVAAVTDLFDGQPQGAPEYSVIQVGDWGGLFAGQTRSELGVGNQLLLAPEKLLANARTVQARNDIEIDDPAAPLEAWELFDTAANAARTCPHFSVEMETGTGKTYVYLRTVFELSRRYGFQKFIVVVPSVAIREGVLKNIEITAEHFRALYNNLPFEHFVYDAKKVNRLRQFAVSNTVQILVINIDAFRKKLHRHRGRAEEQRHLQGERQAIGPAAHRIRTIHPAHRHHRRAAERGRHGKSPGGDPGTPSALHAPLLRHAPQPVQPGLPTGPGAGV
jgi:type III restriction enzyme